MARFIVYGREIKNVADRRIADKEYGSIDAFETKAKKADFDRARKLLRLAPNIEITRLVWVKV